MTMTYAQPLTRRYTRARLAVPALWRQVIRTGDKTEHTMPEPDRSLGKRLHALIKTHAPVLVPKTWYGMPAYARDDQVVCFFQNASKFKVRYATLGFSDKAKLDDGRMWPGVWNAAS